MPLTLPIDLMGHPGDDSAVAEVLGQAQAEFAEALQRARADYLEMPGLKLTLSQASRLWSLDVLTAAAILTALVEAHFLVKTRHSSYLRR